MDGWLFRCDYTNFIRGQLLWLTLGQNFQPVLLLFTLAAAAVAFHCWTLLSISLLLSFFFPLCLFIHRLSSSSFHSNLYLSLEILSVLIYYVYFVALLCGFFTFVSCITYSLCLDVCINLFSACSCCLRTFFLVIRAFKLFFPHPNRVFDVILLWQFFLKNCHLFFTTLHFNILFYIRKELL